jgi:hypothetical protein
MNEDMILPEGFEMPTDTNSSEEVTMPNEQTDSFEQTESDGLNDFVDGAEDTKPATETEQGTQETPQPIKIKYNSEEQEIPYDDAVPLIQKGMNYEKAVERARQEARDSYIAEQGFEWNGEPITTEAQYKQALQEAQWMEQLQNRDLPEEVVQELLESRRDREERNKEKEERAKTEREQADMIDFLNYFRNANGRDFNADQDILPDSVWQANAQGIPLKYAFAEHENNQLRQQLATLKKNQDNARKAPVGGVTQHGSNDTASADPFLAGFDSYK